MLVDIDSNRSISIMEMNPATATALHKALVSFSALRPESFASLGLQPLFEQLISTIKQLGHDK